MIMFYRLLVLLLLSLFFSKELLLSQEKENPLSIKGYTEIYYSYDFAEPDSHIKQSFLYNYNRHNTVNLNLGMLKAEYKTGVIRGNLAFMAGTYVNDNMSAESETLKHLYEANVGVKVSRKSDVWIDAGILPSHIGWESPIGCDYPTLTRSITAENTPAFETGIRFSYLSDDKRWYLSALFLNGWQRIERIKGDNTPAFGHQITFMPTPSITLNSSSFIGNDYTSNDKRMRYFHDLYGVFQINNTFAMTVGFDVGVEEDERYVDGYSVWYSPVVVLSMRLLSGYQIGLRGEYYSDDDGVMLADGGEIFSCSINLDKHIGGNVIWRNEARVFHAQNDMFQLNGSKVPNNISLTTSLAISF